MWGIFLRHERQNTAHPRIHLTQRASGQAKETITIEVNGSMRWGNDYNTRNPWNKRDIIISGGRRLVNKWYWIDSRWKMPFIQLICVSGYVCVRNITRGCAENADTLVNMYVQMERIEHGTPIITYTIYNRRTWLDNSNNNTRRTVLSIQRTQQY